MRSILAPDIPTVAESVVPGFDVAPCYGLFMPAKSPVEIVTKVHDDSVAALGDRGHSKTGGTRREGRHLHAGWLAAHLKGELEKWGPVNKTADIKAE
jgi:tripartite-type tricarboxylate transporter receptor subunit TctC